MWNYNNATINVARVRARVARLRPRVARVHGQSVHALMAHLKRYVNQGGSVTYYLR